MTQTEIALSVIMVIMIWMLLCKDMGHSAGENMKHVTGMLSRIDRELKDLTDAVERLNDTVKITETGEKESWTLNENLEWEKNTWRN